MQQPRRNTKNTKPTGPEQDSYGRLQPQDLDLERAVIGALLLEKDAYAQISEILSPTSFYEKRHQVIFDAVRRLNLEERPVDLLTVLEQLRATEELEQAGGPAYLAQLSNEVISTAHIEYHARIIAQKAMARQLISYTAGIQGKAFDPTTDVDALMQEAEGALFEISQKNLKKDYTQIDPVINDAYELLRKA